MESAHLPNTTINGRIVGQVGYGMLGFAKPGGIIEPDAAVQLLKHAFNNGANVWNGSTHYGTPDANSVHLIKRYFEVYPEDAPKVVVTMKGAFTVQKGPDCTPEGIRASVEETLAILGGLKTLDVFACGRVDPNVPIEVSIRALAELVKEGKIVGIGLSEVSAATIRRAHAVHPISTVEIELSLFTPDPLHNGIVGTCRERLVGITIIAYSPVGRGWLTSSYRSLTSLPETDFRVQFLPRFQANAVQQNAKLAEAVAAIAERKGATTAQVAIGWVCHHGLTIPIPGWVDEGRIGENCKPVELNDADMEELQSIMERLPVAGARYAAGHEKLLNA